MSNIEFIGKIPKTWKIDRIKSIVSTNITKGTTPSTLGFEIEDKNVDNVAFYKIENIKNNLLIPSEDYISQKCNHVMNRSKLKKLDLLFTIAGTIGETVEVQEKNLPGNINQAIAIIRLKDKNRNRYIQYYLKSVIEINKKDSFGGVIKNFNLEMLKNLQVIVPPLSQQTSIANYLDYHTFKIDSKIRLLEKKVEKIDEYKQSLIYETVTKGLDKNVSMKNSGIEWIGMIPQNWKIKRVKDVAKIFKGKAAELFSEKKDGMLPCIDTNFLRKREKSISYNNQGVRITPGKVLILWDGANAGELFLNNDLGYLGSTFGAFNTKIYNKFWFYYLKGIEQNSRNNLIGMGIPHVNGNVLKQTLAIIPTQNEQQEIAKYLDKECLKLDKKKELINKKIELLKEYKQSLIYEAVTGKINIGEFYE